MKNTIVLIVLTIASCSNNQEVLLTEETAIAKLNEFFERLDIEVYNKEKLSEIVTSDFHIFEVGNDFDIDSFDAFIKGIFATVVETKWALSNFDVSIDNKSAHISYFNKGLIRTTQNESIHMNWMESVYMVVDDGELKLKFLQSDVVNQEVEESG